MCIDSALYNGHKEKGLKKTTGKRKEEEGEEGDSLLRVKEIGSCV